MNKIDMRKRNSNRLWNNKQRCVDDNNADNAMKAIQKAEKKVID